MVLKPRRALIPPADLEADAFRPRSPGFLFGHLGAYQRILIVRGGGMLITVYAERLHT